MIPIFSSLKAFPVFLCRKCLDSTAGRFYGIFAGHNRSYWGSVLARVIPLSPGPWHQPPSFLALFLSLSAPAFESDRGLPVPWSLIVQGEESLKGVFPVFEGSSCPFQTLELSHTSFLLLPFAQSLGLCWSPRDVVTGLTS